MTRIKKVSLSLVLAGLMVITAIPAVPSFADEGAAAGDGAVIEETALRGAASVEEGKTYEVKTSIVSKKSGKPPKTGVEEWSKYTKKDGKEMATIVFKSEHYTKVVVDGVTYENENDGGFSTFTIPAVLDTEIEITGTTVAMSTPRDINYIITFSSEGMKAAGGDEPKPEPAKGEFAEGVYAAKNPGAITEGNKMFRCVHAELTVDENGNPVSLDMYLSGTGYTALYAGKVKEGAVAEGNPNDVWTEDMVPAEKRIPFKVKSGGEFDGKYYFTIPIDSLDVTMDLGALSAKYGLWSAKSIRLDKSNFDFETKVPAAGSAESAAAKPADKAEGASSPKTGDSAATGMWLIILAGAVAAVPAVRRRFNK